MVVQGVVGQRPPVALVGPLPEVFVIVGHIPSHYGVQTGVALRLEPMEELP